MQNLSGLDLGEAFFREIIQPLLGELYPGLPLTAGLIGSGSEVLGFDDPISRDHDWGPRLMLFVRPEDRSIKEPLLAELTKRLPREFRGYPVFFPRKGSVSMENPDYPNVDVFTIDEFAARHLGVDLKSPPDNLRWLAISEHRLLGFTAGRLYADALGLAAVRKQLSFYPMDVCLYLMASYWFLIAEEQAFMRRCADRGDELGSRMILARIADRLMRICFLLKGQYAPYSKWFGTAFARLGLTEIQSAMRSALAANDIDERERCSIRMQSLVAKLHDDFGVTHPLSLSPVSYYDRPIQVLFVEKIGEALLERIQDERLRTAPPIGSLHAIGGLVALENEEYAENITALYAPKI